MKTVKTPVLLLALCCTSALADVRTVPFDEVKWQVTSELDYCEVSVKDTMTKVSATFAREAGKPMQLYIKQPSRQFFDFGAEAYSVPPAWSWEDHMYSTNSVRLEASPENRGMLETEFGGAESILDNLVSGNWLNISILDYDLYFPTVRFADVASAFYDCESKLPPVSFESVQRFILSYQSGHTAPNKMQQAQIKDVSELVSKDKRIKKIMVDGHTDGVGDSITNLSVSRRRAEEIKHWFYINGVPKDMIEVRGHGDRYPIASSETPEGQDLNRRVEVRLIRK